MTNYHSPFLKLLEAKNYLNQITHPSELDQLLKSTSVTAYIGFDCTAQSLHVGSLIQIMILRYLQKCGHQPIVLLGGGTTKIGDPSGKDEARQLLDDQKIQENLAGIEKTLKKFDLSSTASNQQYKPFQFVNNAKWLENLRYIDFLRNFGRHFSVNRMLTFDSVKLRLDRDQPLSFLEFNYMILQAYDFYELNREKDCVLQIGGSDQWGNIVAGVELVRRLAATHDQSKEVYGLTTPLLTTSDGKKMGKTANGAIWLDHEMLPVFDYFQYFRNVADADVASFLRFFTELEDAEIIDLEKQDINHQKQILAFEATKICHGKDLAEEAANQAQRIFSSGSNKGADIDLLPGKNLSFDPQQIENGIPLRDILRDAGLCSSGGEAKKLIKNGGVKVNDQQITDEHYCLKVGGDLQENESAYYCKLSVGKKKFFKINITSNIPA